jgi:GNAT superfamily N-acetyltransferase
VTDARLDDLAESARNRGLKLVRSRVRTPGKRRFGKVGLTDKSGKPVFGVDAKGPTAKPEEVEAYLRGLGANDWGASLDVAVRPGKRKKPAKAPPREPANDDRPEPRRTAAPAKPKPKPEPKPRIRETKAADATALVGLIALLGHRVDAAGVRKRIALLAREMLTPLVATSGKDVVGLCGIHRMVTIHRDQAVGRITILVVAEDMRGRGIGRMLMQTAEEHLRKLGCGMVEITSNDRLAEAHAFYRHMGYERTSVRFAKAL